MNVSGETLILQPKEDGDGSHSLIQTKIHQGDDQPAHGHDGGNQPKSHGHFVRRPTFYLKMMMYRRREKHLLSIAKFLGTKLDNIGHHLKNDYKGKQRQQKNAVKKKRYDREGGGQTHNARFRKIESRGRNVKPKKREE